MKVVDHDGTAKIQIKTLSCYNPLKLSFFVVSDHVENWKSREIKFRFAKYRQTKLELTAALKTCKIANWFASCQLGFLTLLCLI